MKSRKIHIYDRYNIQLCPWRGGEGKSGSEGGRIKDLREMRHECCCNFFLKCPATSPDRTDYAETAEVRRDTRLRTDGHNLVCNAAPVGGVAYLHVCKPAV